VWLIPNLNAALSYLEAYFYASLLTDIESFIREEQARPFFKAIFTHDARLEGIDGFYRRIGTLADAFQVRVQLVRYWQGLFDGKNP
jgi:hypothetical protein